MSLTIEELDLSNNKFDEQSSSALETWFSKSAEYSSLQILRLANTNQSFATLAGYFHFLTSLYELDLSNSKLDQRTIQVLCSTIDKSSTLQFLNLSNCNLGGGGSFAALIIKAFTGNKKLKNTNLKLSNVEITELEAESIATALSLNINCFKLDISKNKLKEKGLIGVLQSIVLSASKILDSIILDQTYKNTYPGERVSSALMSVSNSLSCVKSISIAGGFGSVAIPFLKYLEGNSSLLELDISNNYMGDGAASAISDMLRNNHTLLRLKCDGNNISPSGWKMILASFMHNCTLVEMDFPWNDYARYSSLPKDKLAELRAVLIDIQRALQTNHSGDLLEGRLDPPPSRPLPTYVHPSANLPGKLAPTSAGLSSLAAQKMNVSRDDISTNSNIQQNHPLFDDSFDQITDTTSESDFDESKQHLDNSDQQSPRNEWYTDTESFSDDDFEFERSTSSNKNRNNPNPITLATLNGSMVPVPARERPERPVSTSLDRDRDEDTSRTSEKEEEPDDESMMSSDSDFDI